jgi:hypothetical protein
MSRQEDRRLSGEAEEDLPKKQRNARWILGRALVLSAIIEGITLLCRFGLGLQATRDTAATIGCLTLGIRVHHSYVGVAVIAAAWLLRRRPALFRWLAVLGLALLLSDLAHHFLVLWPIVGSPEFHLVYP